ncbi:citron rho-interacting kinase-like isoform X2 [Ptychodera flava]|uniref:citron rho-interacting kinase-like isoform X2 n=1 Tax=Ptychodera flava TaxID=63121 RepID=UPI00396A1015
MGTPEPISTRNSKLNQLFWGKAASVGPRTLATRESLLDALFVLYDECNTEHFRRDKHIATFINKYKTVIGELHQLRLGISDFELRNVIGRGHFGEVQVVKEKSTGDVYAMKILKKSETLSQENVAFFEEERDIMAKAKNPWITSLQYAFQDHKNLYLVMEFHPGGDLLSLLSRYDDIFEESMAKFYLAEMVVAIHSLHQMGYVHRDIKPDNVLIDRTGHIKLADFGSAAKLSVSKTVTSQMPVGTPDYVAPEVLTSMNGRDKSSGNYGRECDWWSLGVVMYEMLFGKTPFTGDSIVITYSNIMNFKKSLKFSPDIIISKEARQLVKELLSEKDERLGYEELGCHAFFADIDWTTIRQIAPPFVPTVGSVDDTSNFDEFEPEVELPDFENMRKKKEFSGKDLPFVGFTFTKNLVNTLSGDRQLSVANDIASPAAKSNLERRLTVKTRELQEAQEKFNQLQHQQSAFKNKADQHASTLREKEEELKRVQNERDILERDMALYITEVKNLKRMLELQKKEQVNTDITAVQLLSDIQEKNKKAKELKEELQRGELEEYRQAMAQFEQDRFVAARRAERLESELKSQQKECEEAKSKVNQLHSKLIKMKDNTKCDVVELQTKLESMTEESSRQISEYKKKLEKALESSSQATKLLQHSRQTMNEMESELASLRKQENNKAELEEKLQASEGRRKSAMKRLRELEERDSKLNESMETKHQLTQDLSKQILELEEKYEETERENKKLRRTVEMTEKELDDKIQEYEHKLKVASIKKKTVRFDIPGDDHHDDSESDTKLKERISEQQNTITMLQANISVLEKQIEEMITTKNQKLHTERKEHERAIHEKLADLQQEKMYLETQNSNLKCKIQQLEMSQNTQNSSMNDLEERLSQTITHYEGQLSDLRSRLQCAVKASNDSTDKLCQIEDNEKKLKAKIDKLQSELETACSQAEHKISKLQGERDEITEKYETLRESCEVITEMEDQLSQLAEQNTELNQQNQELDKQVDNLQNEVDNKETEIERLQDEVVERKHKCEGHELTISMLKSTCTMLEEQVLDLEALNERLEEREASWNDTKAALEKEVEAMEIKVTALQQDLSSEKQSRLYAEEKGIELAETLEDSNKAHRGESERLQKQLLEQKQQASKLSDNLNDLEKKHSILELNVKSLQRQYNDEKALSEKLKEEVHKLITQVTSLKSSNFKLTQGLEEAIEKGELLKTERIDLENELENLQVQFSHQRIKLEGTISQQTKLIDFLQTKVETPAKKKRKFLPHRKNKEPAPPPGLPLQYKDLQQNLEREISRRVQLQEQLNKMKVEMQAAKREVVLAKAKHGDIVSQTPCSQGVVSAIMLSPSHQPSASSLLLAPGTRKKEKTKSDSLAVHRPKERMKHNIPHRFTTGLNMRATKCAVCMDSIHFGRQASKCHECHLVCHTKCSSLLPHTCGLPSQLMEHFSEAIVHTSSPAVGSDSTDDSMMGLEGWMKVPRPGKQGWEKKWVLVDGSKVCIYDKENSLETIDEFDLCPPDGKVTVHAAVTPAELLNTASTDLPYILRLELHPKTTCWPGRNMYLMAMSFPDKQKWMMSLEGIVTSGNENLTRANAKMIGNCLIVLEDEDYVDMNCTLLLDDQILLIGAEEGLYAMDIKKRDKISCLDGVDSVFQMQSIAQLGLVVMIAGDDRQLCTVDYKLLKTRASQASVTQSVIDPKVIDDVTYCHLFAVGSDSRSVYLCAAMPEKIVLMKYNSSMGVFCVQKEIETVEPCSCIHFTHASVLVGTDKFYEIDLQQNTVEEFLDPSDTSLAYALYGARHVNSFPISILQVSKPSEPIEFLLCFHEFGVFVDEYGRRTRTDDMKWTCLPLAFSYRAPFLYVIHFNSLEVCNIRSENQSDSSSHTFIDLVNPRYVGPAITDGAIYVASCHEDVVELLCLQGNTTNSDSENVSEAASQRTASESKPQSSSKRPLTEVSYNQTPLRRSTRLKGSPPGTNPATKRARYDRDHSTQV